MRRKRSYERPQISYLNLLSEKTTSYNQRCLVLAFSMLGFHKAGSEIDQIYIPYRAKRLLLDLLKQA